MIITRTPLRITLGGGGTDLPSYYRKAGTGFLVAAAINKYVYIAVNRNFDDDILLRYSHYVRVPRPEDAQHPLLRECLLCTGVRSTVEVSSMADIPAGTGLGSSGAFTVGVLKALHAYQHQNVPNEQLAREACDIEIDRLREPVGKQDQYIAAMGGLSALEFHADERVVVRPVEMADDVREGIEENLLLFFTGLRRRASEELGPQRESSGAVSNAAMDANLDAVRELGYQTHDAMTTGDLPRFGKLLTEQWQLKLERAPTPVHSRVDGWIRAGVGAGALGGKLVGAGGGGFLLFYAENKAPLRSAMRDLGLDEVRFAFDGQGSTILAAS